MELMEVIQKRRSIRSFKDVSVPVEKLRNILDAGRLAPSPANTQPWEFILVDDPELVKKIGDHCLKAMKTFFTETLSWHLIQLNRAQDSGLVVGDVKAPYYIVCVGLSDMPPRWTFSETRDRAEAIWMAIENMLLAVTNEGLGSVAYTTYNEEYIKEILGIPKWPKHTVFCILPIGYPGAEPIKKPAYVKGLSVVSRYNRHDRQLPSEFYK